MTRNDKINKKGEKKSTVQSSKPLEQDVQIQDQDVQNPQVQHEDIQEEKMQKDDKKINQESSKTVEGMSSRSEQVVAGSESKAEDDGKRTNTSRANTQTNDMDDKDDESSGLNLTEFSMDDEMLEGATVFEGKEPQVLEYLNKNLTSKVLGVMELPTMSTTDSMSDEWIDKEERGFTNDAGTDFGVENVGSSLSPNNLNLGEEEQQSLAGEFFGSSGMNGSGPANFEADGDVVTVKEVQIGENHNVQKMQTDEA